MAGEIINPETMALIKQEESLKIERNSRSVIWEFKLIGNVEEQIKRAEEIDKLLLTKFRQEVK